MKRKTAMQELVEWISNNGMSPDCGVPDIKLKAQQLLEKEKEQIIEAFDTACEDQDRIGKEYYSETYKQD